MSDQDNPSPAKRDQGNQGMESIEFECGSCGRRLTAKAEMAGRKVRCPGCKTVIDLPPLEAPEEPPEEAPEEAAEEEERPAARPGRARDGARPARDDARAGRLAPPRPKSKGFALQLALLGGGLAFVAIVALVLVSVLGGREKGGKAGGGGASGGKGGEAPRDPKRESKSRYQEALEKIGDSDRPSAWVDLGDLAARAGLPEKAREHYRKALELQPEFEPAMGKLGYAKYEPAEDLQELSLERDPPEEIGKRQGAWVSPEEMARLRGLEKAYRDEVQAELQKKRDDPFYAAVEQVKTSFLSRKGLDQFLFETKREAPYVVFEQVGEKAAGPRQPDAKTARLLEEKLRMLRQLLAEAKRRWMDPFGLTMDPRLPMVVFALQDRESFDQLNRELGVAVPPGGLAYYNPMHTYIILYNGVYGSATRRAKAVTDGIVFHEGTHQILNAFINKGKGPDSADSIRIPFWVNEGLAEYMGSVEIAEEAGPDGFDVYRLGVPNAGRLMEFWAARQRRRAQNVEIPPLYFDLWELVECFDAGTITSLAKKKVGDAVKADSGGPLWEYFQQAAYSLVYAEASSFFLFCYEYQGGKYAKNVDAYLRGAFGGRHHTRYLLEAFGVEDLKGINREWLGYVDGLIKDVRGG
jgi:DNA-directed RNA polymerase subunit RPC12/RpoP